MISNGNISAEQAIKEIKDYLRDRGKQPSDEAMAFAVDAIKSSIWTPVDEKPSDSRNYLVSLKENSAFPDAQRVRMGFFDADKKAFEHGDAVEAWMPAPAAYHAELKNFYFVFDDKPMRPYQNTYLVVVAKGINRALKKFSQKYPLLDGGRINCAYVCGEDWWKENNLAEVYPDGPVVTII